MNKIIKKVNKNGEVSYTLLTENGEKLECSRWYEKKTDAWHVKLPKDNPSGRTYIRESNFADKNEVEFETKTEHRVGLTGGSWRSKMTAEEEVQVREAEDIIARIKLAASARNVEKVDPNSIEGLEAAIAKAQAKLAAKKAAAVK